MNDITEGDPRDGRSRVFLYATLAKANEFERHIRAHIVMF